MCLALCRNYLSISLRETHPGYGAEAGDSARIVREAGAGVVCDFTKSKIKNELARMFSQWKEGRLHIE